jgi:ferric-dicitrate binding protein FerR (iron transport regulator)
VFKLPVAPRASLLKVAAAIALMVGATATATYLYQPTTRAPVDEGRVVNTERGVRATLRLPDGSQVVLGVASVLRFPRVFPSSRREVELSGQAYFAVQPDAKRPFVVRAGNLIATDLGTEFSVRAYPDDAQREVAVTVGSVALTSARGDSASRVIHPGELGRLTPGGAVEISSIDADRYLSWTRGWLEFESTPLGEALGDLSRWYDLDFRLSDSTLGRVPLTARLGDQPDAIDGLVASLGLRLQRQGRTITLYPAISPR